MRVNARHPMVLIATAALLVLATPAAPASAHELIVTPPGPAELDLGTGEPLRLVHATLAPGDELTVTIRLDDAAAAAWRVQTLVPASSERGDTDARVLLDEGTRVEYRVVQETVLASIDAVDGVRTISVRGTRDQRVALRVAPEEAAFESTGLDRVPRTLIRLRAWEQAAPRTKQTARQQQRAERDANRTAIIGFGIALVGVLVMVWWVAAGRARSRTRGTENERSRRERDT